MKKFIFFTLGFIALCMVVSCDILDEENIKNETQDVKTIVELPDEVKKKVVEQDSLMKDIVFKVDTLTTELNSVKKENVELKEKLNGITIPQRTLWYISLGSLVFALIAFLLGFFRRGLSEQEVIAVATDRLDRSQRLKDLQYNVNILINDFHRLTKSTQTKSPSASSDIEYQLQKMEKTVHEVVSYINSQQSAPSINNSSYSYSNYQQETTEVMRAGYANINTGKYFTKILNSNQETCVFSITFRSEIKGEFTIISLDKIKSRNGWQEVVEYTGSIEDATYFKEVEKGICEKVDESTWEVTKPLKIRLLK